MTDWGRFRIAEDAVVAAAARWSGARKSEAAARADFARRAAAWQEAGASLRNIAGKAGVSHAQVRRLIEEAPEPEADPLRQPVPTLTAAQLLEYYLPVFGEPTEVLVAFNNGDILLNSGKHPEAYTTESDSLTVPHMLLINKAGEMLGVTDCNCGYIGTGPGNTQWLLQQLDWPTDQLHLIPSNRFLHLTRGSVLAQAVHPVSHVAPGMVHVQPEGGINVHVDKPRRGLQDRFRQHFWTDNWLENGEGNTANDWLTEVLNFSPRFFWADGPRVARCYLNYNAIEAAGLRFDRAYRGPGLVTVIIEQGETQLWCETSLPLDWTQLLSDETFELLEEADVYPQDLRETQPRTWFQKTMAKRASRPDFYDISEGGTRTLQRPPESTT